MSGVYIKDMEMPMNCYECLVRNQGFSGDGMKCGKTGSVLSWYDGTRKRMDNCPLSPVPQHGRLIDADAVSLEGGPYEYDEWCKWALDQYQDAPTIIPAEEGTDIQKRFLQNWHEEDET